MVLMNVVEGNMHMYLRVFSEFDFYFTFEERFSAIVADKGIRTLIRI